MKFSGTNSKVTMVTVKKSMEANEDRNRRKNKNELSSMMMMMTSTTRERAEKTTVKNGIQTEKEANNK